MSENHRQYCFELLLEEIPAWMHDAAQSALHERLTALLGSLGVTDPAKCVSVTTTSRRIAFLLSGLPLKEEDRDQEVKGPPRKSAYDASGAPTPALQGFLKKNAATTEDILESSDEYVRIRRKVAGRRTADVLREKVAEIVESLRWPKSMRWGTGEISYIRPVHSVLSIFDGAHLPIRVLGCDSGTSTVGHRILAPQRIEVSSYGDYIEKLELARVVVDATRRRHVMAERARVLANEVNGAPSVDPTIWSQWQYLTEYPGIVRAEFGADYLSLPEEVLVMVMRVHQKQLPIRDASGKLTRHFLAVLDNEGDPDGHAAYGNSFVTNARFADALFFFETDRKTRLEDRVATLSHLQFQEKLGNYEAKTRRIEQITAAICAEIGVEPTHAATAALLSKADLVTEMVKEFTELQGKIGGIYARLEGQPDEVWQAIYDHYQPVSADDELPRTMSGAIVSVADKIDTLTGFFSAGLKPTGSKDPFALRRAAQGVILIFLNRDKRQLRIGIDRLIDLALEAYNVADGQAIRNELLTFFAERIRTLLESEPYSLAYDEIAAAMEAGWAESVTDFVDRAHALQLIRADAGFLSVLDSAKRITNITADFKGGAVDPSRFEHEIERRLYALGETVTEQIDELVAEKRYQTALESFAGLAPELERFFQEVMVMVDDPVLRENRMSLLRRVGSAVARIADVTRIVVDRSDYRS